MQAQLLFNSPMIFLDTISLISQSFQPSGNLWKEAKGELFFIVAEISRDLKNLRKRKRALKSCISFRVLHKLSITTDFTLLNKLSRISILSDA